MFRSRRATLASPDRGLATLVETSVPALRAAPTLRDAIAVVLRDVADVTGFRAGHAWLPGDAPGTWESAGLWFPDDGLALGGLRDACFTAPPAPARGHLASALARGGADWGRDLVPLAGTRVHDAAVAAGVASAVSCPVYARGAPVALLEWYLGPEMEPDRTVQYVLGHLSSVLSDVAERGLSRPEPGTIPQQSCRTGVVATLLRR